MIYQTKGIMSQVKELVQEVLTLRNIFMMQKNYKNIKKPRTYGAPVFDLLGSESKGVDRYRNWLDPVSVLDRSAKKSFKENPFDASSLTHDYSNIAKNFTSTDYIKAPTRNTDGSLLLF